MKTLQFLPASFCIVFFLLQACVSNNISSERKDRIESITVRTHDGNTYDLPWYEVEEGKLVSTLNTSRIVLDREQIIEVAIYNPEPTKSDLGNALIHNGSVSIIAFDDGQRVHNHKFYEFVEVKGQLVGYTYTGGHTADIIIPFDNVKKIDVEKAIYKDDAATSEFDWSILMQVAFEILYSYYGY